MKGLFKLVALLVLVQCAPEPVAEEEPRVLSPAEQRVVDARARQPARQRAQAAQRVVDAAFPELLRELGSYLALERRGQMEQGDEWRDRFGTLARPGADLSRVVDEWTHWLLSGSDSPLARWRDESPVSAVARLYARHLAGDEPARHEWLAAQGIAYAASHAEDPAAGEAAHAASSACLVIMGMDGASNTASIATIVAVEEAAKRDGNYDQSDAAFAAARTRMANKLAEIIAAK